MTQDPSPKLTIHFSGLSPLVPRREADGGEADEFLVALPDLQRGGQGWDLPMIPPHQAVLVVPEGTVDLERSTKHPFLRLSRRRGKSSAVHPDGWDPVVLVYRFDTELVSLAGAGSAISVEGESPSGEVPDEGEEHLLAWVPSMEDLGQGADEFDGIRHLRGTDAGERVAPASTLAGVLRLDRGHLDALDVLRMADGAPARYAFRGEDGSDVHTQAFAEAYRWSVPMVGGGAELRWSDDEGAVRRLYLRSDDGVGAWVLNRELEEIVGIDADPPSAATDPDFLIFYRLSTAWDALDPERLPLPLNVSEGGGGKNRACEPAKFSSSRS